MKRFSKEELRACDERHKAQVQAIAAKGMHSKLGNAEQYILRHIRPLWYPVLGWDPEDGLAPLGFTPTMKLIVYLFARAVHHLGVGRSTLPVLTAWKHIIDDVSGQPRFPHAIAKRDIARMIGKSPSAVVTAIARFRKETRYQGLIEKQLAYLMAVDTGILPDLMVEPQMSFAFTREEYDYAHRYARQQRIHDSPANMKQCEWCNDATEAKLCALPASASLLEGHSVRTRDPQKAAEWRP